MKTFIAYFLLLSLLLPYSLAGQNLRQISNREGLSNNSILSLTQDASGYVWLGTCDGLNRWNGTAIKSYKTSGNLVQEIITTDDGPLWIRTNYGLDKLNPIDQSMTHYTEFPRVYQFTARTSREVFMIYKNKLHYYNANHSRFEKTSDKELDLRTTDHIYLDKSGFLWFVGRDSITHIKTHYPTDGTKPTFEQVARINHASKLEFSIYDYDKTIYFIDQQGIMYGIDTERKQKFYIYDLSNEIRRRGNISSIVKDNDNYVVSFELSGAISLRAVFDNACRYEVVPIESVDCGVFAVMKDRNQDIIWIGSDGGGLYQQTNSAVSIDSYTYNQMPYGLKKPVKTLFVDHNNDLWIGTKNDGIVRIRDFYNQRGAYTTQNTDLFTTANSTINNNSIYALAGSCRNVMWIGGYGPGLNYYSYRDKKIHLLSGSGYLQKVHDILETNDSTLYVATIGHGYGVYKVNIKGPKETPQATSIEPIYINNEALTTNFFFSLCEESDSVIWLANHGVGAVRYNVVTKKSTIVKLDTARGLAINDVTVILKDHKGHFWFGTGAGIDHYQPFGNYKSDIHNLNPDNDILRHSVIHGMLEDSHENIWLSTNTGIVKYSPKSNSSVVYGYSYGLGVVEFSDEAYFRDTTNKVLFFGGINGFISIREQESQQSTPYMPPLLFNEIDINDGTHSIANLMKGNTLVMNNKQRSFTLSFMAFDYINGSNYSYFYNLEESNDNWIDNKSLNKLTFANMPVGQHLLRVRYRNNTTGAESPVYNLYIKILPAWYNTTLAHIIYTLFALSIIGLTVRYFIRKQRIKVSRLQQNYEQHQREMLYESRLWSFTNLTNELSIPLTLINGPCQQIIDYSSDTFVRKQAEFIQRNAFKLNDLISMLNELKESGNNEKAGEIELVNVSDFVGSISATFLEYAGSKGIVYQTNIDKDLIYPSDKNTLSTILTVILSNAFKRTDVNGNISLEINQNNDILNIKVSNNGTCLNQDIIDMIYDKYKMFDYFEAQNRKGISVKEDLEMLICCNLITKLEGTFEITNLRGKSTQFNILLPRLEISMTTHSFEHPYLIQSPHHQAYNTDLQHKTRSKNPMMLIANENDEITTFTAQLFTDEYRIEVITDLTATTDELSKLRPDIIICGSILLNNKIIALIKQIKQQKHMTHIPIILLTGTSQIDSRIQSLELGVDICLTLPFNVKYLKVVANQLLKKYEILKESSRSILNSFEIDEGKILHKEDKEFLDKMLEVIHENILNPDISTQFIADNMGVSLGNLYRKLDGITTQTPANIIKEYRLLLAEQCLITTKLTIDEVIYRSGFGNRSTFFKCFTTKFGVTPKVYREQKMQEMIGSEE